MEKSLTQNQEDLLENIYRLTKAGYKPRVSDIAHIMHQAKPAITRTLIELRDLKLVIHESYAAPVLTPRGATIARKILGRHVLLHRFLTTLGVTEEIAEKDACIIEHCLSQETLSAILSYVDKNAPFNKPKDRLEPPPLTL